MSKYSGKYLNDQICQAVGVNPNSVYRVIVDCQLGEVAKVITHGFVETDDGKIDHLKKVIRHYELRPKVEKGKVPPKPVVTTRPPLRKVP